MLLYHIADLHIGKNINGTSLIDDQRYWIDRFSEQCDKGHPDAILIAGDVYDRVNPSGDAVELLDFFITELESRNVPVFMISGNHDSGQKLRFAKSILAKRSIHIAGTVSKEIAHHTMEDPDGYGPVTIWMLPYVFPEAVKVLLDDNTISTYTDAVSKLIAAQNIDTTHRNVILSHQNVTANGKEVEYGGSETMVGGIGAVEYTVYKDFDYVALGHIHSGFDVGRPTVRYAGAPLCYHFDETKYEWTIGKGIVEVELGEKGEAISPSIIRIEPLHKMHPITGTKDEIYDEVENRVADGEYVKVTITDMRMTSEISDYLREIITSRNGLLLETLSTYNAFSNSGSTISSKEVQEKPIEDLFADFYKSQTNNHDPSEEEFELLHFLGEIVRNEKESTLEEDVQKILDKLDKMDGGNA